MSETGEIPQTSQNEGGVPDERVADTPEFQKFSPEKQERILAAYERLKAEALSPERVVGRSINEMGFWEGLKETVKPHLAKQKEIAFKELKAGASLALSLVPVLGQGKGLGTGLFGITVKAGAPVEQAIKFEPLIRGKKAVETAKRGYSYLRAYSAAEHVAHAAAAAEKAPGFFTKTGARIKDSLRPASAIWGGKTVAERSLIRDFRKAAKKGAEVTARNLGVGEIQVAQQAGKIAERAAYVTTKAAKTAEAGIKDRKWYELGKHWKAIGVERAAKTAMKAEKANTAVNVKAVIETGFQGRNLNAAQRWVESGVKKAAPTAIEATHKGAYKNFFEKWLNFTPDVPVWLSTTTGVAEFLGAHGIDAIPAVIQMAVDRYQQVKVSKDMAVDVLGYTVGRVLNKSQERKAAAEVFAARPAGAPSV